MLTKDEKHCSMQVGLQVITKGGCHVSKYRNYGSLSGSIALSSSRKRAGGVGGEGWIGEEYGVKDGYLEQ